MAVVVQFCVWFKFVSFVSNSVPYRSLAYLKTKEREILNQGKINRTTT